MQSYLKPLYSVLRHQKRNFEWTTEHQKQFEELKTLLIPSQIQTNNFMLCATPQNLASTQHYYNLTVEQIK